MPEVPGPEQESVWSFPRPPVVRAVDAHVQVVLGGVVVCDTRRPLQLLETSHPPTYYLPLADWLPGSLTTAAGSSLCEYKGPAAYLTVAAGGVVAQRAAWTYPDPWPGYETLADHVAVYAREMDRCTVDGELVRPQPGGFYGGWVTDAVVGPFKGGPGSMGW